MSAPSILFAHAAYQLGDEFARRGTGESFREVRTVAEVEAAIGDVELLVISGLWRDHFLELAPRLRFIQSISAGVDQFGKQALAARGVRLASAQGANERAVSEHALSLVLALTRKLHLARDNQAKRFWRPMISDPLAREIELAGRTMLVVGLGRIGKRVARLARAFEMNVIATKRDTASGEEPGIEIHPQSELMALLPRADVVVLTCPLTPQTERLINAEALSVMKPGALLVNAARGRVVDEPALIGALASGRIAGAALDVTVEEPLPADSPLWSFENVLITPHSAGETDRYEATVVDLFLTNRARLERGEALVNPVV